MWSGNKPKLPDRKRPDLPPALLLLMAKAYVEAHANDQQDDGKRQADPGIVDRVTSAFAIAKGVA